jgi:DNA replication protein DnaC
VELIRPCDTTLWLVLASPRSREEASLFFRLLVRRYERGSLIVSSNKSFTDWGEVFSDRRNLKKTDDFRKSSTSMWGRF